MKNRLLLLVLALFTIAQAQAQINITDAKGWLESAYVKWTFAETDTFTVYYSGGGISDKQIDTQLIRSYGSYYRADVLGLAAGNDYTITIVPVINDVEDFDKAASTISLTVGAYDRSGFAFSNGRVPGAYKADGTPKDGALILYITEKTKNTLSVTVTGANANPCVGLQTILEGFKKGNDTRPLIIRLIGQVTDPSYLDKGDIVIENKNNASSYITLEGVGDDAVADGWGIRMKSASNVEIRNIATMNCDSNEGDNIGLQQDNDYIWVHNCDFFYGHAGSDSDQQKGDGALDCKRSKYVTFSYNHFWDSGKASLLGNNDGEYSFYITYHHNWFDHSDSRHPRVRCFSTHVYNNYYDGIAKYGIGATVGSSIFAEANYFRNCKYPMLISLQGTDATGEGTFSGDAGGMIKAYNNHIEGTVGRLQYANAGIGVQGATVAADATSFDAYLASSQKEKVPDTYTTVSGGNKYDNFDTNSAVMYEYTPDSPEDAKTKVMEYAGRMFGGDFQWTFDNSVDDTSYDVNAALKTALTNYQTSLVSIQGDGDGSSGGGGGGGVVIPGDETHNFTTDGLANSFYTIANGNLATKEGSIEYDGATLTQYLKIESKTTITFKMAKNGTLTLVFNSNSSGNTISIDGQTITIPSDGIVTVTGLLAETQYTVARVKSESYLYYMSVVYEGGTTKIENTADNTLTVYPNPVSDNLYIKSDAEVQSAEVYSLTGVLMFSSNGNIDRIDMSSFSAGNYIVKIRTNEGATQKLIIKK